MSRIILTYCTFFVVKKLQYLLRHLLMLLECIIRPVTGLVAPAFTL
jgi:hypothetical protein